VQSNSSGVLPFGNAAWVYDLSYGKMQAGGTAMWASWIGKYNSVAKPGSVITTVYTYGGDMEYYPDDPTNPYQTYFTPDNQAAALAYKSVPGVKYVIAVCDGRMDGGEEWSPDLSQLTLTQTYRWADRLARLYCSYDFIDGVQVDLEPFRAPYATNLLGFMNRLAGQLLIADNNCVNSHHPYGRSLGTFMMAASATPAVFAALGSNSYIAISGYDIGVNTGIPQSPADYAASLTHELNILIQNAGSNGKYIIGVPGAASTMEFSKYITAAGAVTQGFPMYSATDDNYIGRAIQTVHSMLNGRPGFLGISLWGFSSEMSYPPHSFNLYYPCHPFATPGALEYISQNL